MSRESEVRALRRLAVSYGIQWRYRDVRGDLVESRPEPLLGILRAAGAPVESLGGVEEALRARRDELTRRVVPPVLTSWSDSPAAVALRLPPDVSGTLRVELELESGERVVLEPRLEDLRAERRRGGTIVRKLPLPELPEGYHRLELERGGELHATTLIRAPRRVYRDLARPPRTWGLFAPIYAIPSSKGWGVGDLTELESLVDVIARFGGAFAATLPLYAAFPDESSPYSPASRLFWNELYLDPTRTPEWARSPRAREIAAGAEFQARALDAHELPLVDHVAAHRLRRPLLDALTNEAERSRPEAFARFVAEHPRTLDYARFRATLETGRARDAASVDATNLLDEDSPEVRTHVYAQMAMDEQMDALVSDAEGRGVGLYFDLPLGVHGGSYDVWRFGDVFARGVEVGAPPDPVFTDGQSWGFPPLLPQSSRASGHGYLRLVLERAMRHASMLRIDHVMGLHRQFWIPAGFEKREGVYVRFPASELYAVLSLESHRARAEVVGENLGIVPPVVDRAMEEHALSGLYVLQYSMTGNPEAPARPVPASSVASLGTHDTPPFAGFCLGRDLEWRLARGLEDPESASRVREERDRQIAALDAVLGTASGDLHDRLRRWLHFLLESEGERVAITLEDLWLEEEPQNVPGTTSREHASWTRKLRFALEALPQETLELLSSFVRED